MSPNRCRHGVPVTQECPRCIDRAEHERDHPEEDPERGQREYEKWLTELSNKW